ncbi:hypothetical protein EDB84DRAFT_1051634 [Lactarius hengduanensis]|nr:hypothetical protein EDB84DRAFT_1051634 [Lactarius hengduanensis]
MSVPSQTPHPPPFVLRRCPSVSSLVPVKSSCGSPGFHLTLLREARSYIAPVQIGEVMRSLGLATVVQDRFPEAFTNLGRWISEGRIIHKFQVVEGLEKAPESLPLLFSGGNIGKLVVHVSGPRADL